jgi:hypothetical protein
LAEIGADHLQDSVWGVNSTSSAEVVFDYLWQHVHSERDRLFVVNFEKANGYKSKNAMSPLKDI